MVTHLDFNNEIVVSKIDKFCLDLHQIVSKTIHHTKTVFLDQLMSRKQKPIKKVDVTRKLAQRRKIYLSSTPKVPSQPHRERCRNFTTVK